MSVFSVESRSELIKCFSQIKVSFDELN